MISICGNYVTWDYDPTGTSRGITEVGCRWVSQPNFFPVRLISSRKTFFPCSSLHFFSFPLSCLFFPFSPTFLSLSLLFPSFLSLSPSFSIFQYSSFFLVGKVDFPVGRLKRGALSGCYATGCDGGFFTASRNHGISSRCKLDCLWHEWLSAL